MKRLVKNTKTLAKTPLRADALRILEAGLAAVDTQTALEAQLRREGETLWVGKKKYHLDRYKRVFVVAIGKAAFVGAKTLERVLGNRITDGVVLDVRAGKLKRMTSRAGSHPFPSLPNMKATGEIVALLREAGEEDLVIASVSGGGSALLCWPSELTCSDLALITKTLMARGASIQEINTLRKHTSDILGGQLVALAAPAEVVGLIFSDVPGDDLSMIASGPTVYDKTTATQAKEVLNRYDLLRVCRLPSCELKETPKDKRLFRRVYNHLIVSNQQALMAMRQEAQRLGYRARVLSSVLYGEARDVGARLASTPKAGEVVLAAGETTVTVVGKGKGGRNQEVALGALEAVDEATLVLSCASDGIDNTPAAGAIADDVAKREAKRKGLSAKRALASNDAFPFFAKAHAHILTGPTDRNISDIMIAMRSR